MPDYLPIKTSHALKGTGLTVGALAYGCWRMAGTGLKAATTNIETALDHGMNLIDTADIYTSCWPDGFGEAESLLGELIAAQPALRQRMVLATKGGIVPGLPYNSDRDYIIQACEASLMRLNTDVIDLYQIHRPDLTAPFAETADALNRLLAAGKIRAIGVSNFSTSQFDALQAHLDAPIATIQPEISCLATAPLFNGLLDQCQQYGMPALAWSPLAGGALFTGKAENPHTQTQLSRALKVLDRIAHANAVDRSAVALAFLLCHPAGIIPIIGTQTPARITSSQDALTLELTRRDWYDILEASLGEVMP